MQPEPAVVLPWHPREPRKLSAADWERFEGYVEEIFIAFGLEPNTPGTRETPERFLRALYDATAGYDGDAKLRTAFPAEGRGGLILEGPISFFALCEHHALPFVGRAYVGYIAHEEIIGISKLTRLVRLWARRFTLQERMGDQIADTLNSLVHAHGVAVYLEAHHLCTQMRGVREMQAKTRTAVWRGEYTENSEIRNEFFHLAGVGVS